MKNMLLVLLLLLSAFSRAGEVKVVTSDGVSLYVKVEGQGTPLLYIHGGPNSGSLWFEEITGPFLEQHFKVVYLDLRGVGRSTSAPDGNYSLDRLSLDFEEIRTQLGFEQWFTMGHSFAGILQTAYAQRYPDAHLGMLMINCTLNITESGGESWVPKAAEFLGKNYSCSGGSDQVRMAMEALGEELRQQDLFWKMGFENPEHEKQVNKYFERIQHYNFDFGAAVWSDESYWDNFKKYTSSIDIPVLYFYGTRDWMVGPQHYKEIDFPNLLLWKSEVGHFPFLENQEDLYQAILTYKSRYDK